MKLQVVDSDYFFPFTKSQLFNLFTDPTAQKGKKKKAKKKNNTECFVSQKKERKMG